ncbi:MAG: response regulator [Oscillospiraceae bacterium]|nr:response regulator [Oscillospiraceae bacterium]
MRYDKRYKVLIVEDDVNYSGPLQLCISRSDDFSVLSITTGADEAYKLVQTGLPDAVIVDLELSDGDGLSLLNKIRQTECDLAIKPYLLVVTDFGDKSMALAKAKDELADFIIKKHNHSYSPDAVLEHLRLMSNFFHRNKEPYTQQKYSELETEALIRARIDSELSRYYISHGNPAREYLEEAIYRVLQYPKSNLVKINKIIVLISAKFCKQPQAVEKAIRRLLYNAFEKTDTEDLSKVYTPYIDIGRGVPTSKEFILYTADKIRKEKIF